MRFNWGTGLTIFFILFIATLGFVLFKSRQVENSLVMDNYYDEDLKYQEHYDKLTNTSALKIGVKIENDKQTGKVSIVFPGDSTSVVKGTALLYNPASQKADVKYDFELKKSLQYFIPVDTLSKGKWKIKLDWTQDGKPYYYEETIII